LIIKAKFALASTASLAITLTLVGLSCWLLNMPWERTLYFGLIVTIMTFTMNGLAIGLGVLYPNFKEENPSKIVSGFGGTFCLVLSFLYILASVLLLALSAPWSAGSGAMPIAWLLAGWAGFAGLSLAVGWLPFQLGLRRAATFEF